MSGSAGPIYEVTLSIDRGIIGSFDGWLAHHVEEMLALPGFVEAKVFALDDSDDGRARRITHYYLESETHLEEYLSGPAAEMRQSGIDRFGDRFSASRRILRETDIADSQIQRIEICLNCGAVLGGQYCGNCGQRSQNRLISLWELIRDAFGDLFELDSRIWRTIIPLLLRPGRLTREYLEGRRARFMPPFRTYLVLSILFFLLLFFDPRENFEILFEPEPDTPEATDTSAGTDEQRTDDDIWTGSTIEVSPDQDDFSCDIGSMEEVELPGWLGRRMTPERLEVVCKKLYADNGKAFFGKLLDNTPAALFVLLPLMAFILKLLYPLSKRYYVEHLLFVVHFHAFIFLTMSLLILFSRLGTALQLPSTIVGVVLVITWLYVPIYFYKAIRQVYDQGHLTTILKFLFLLIAYIAGLVLVLTFTALFAAFSI